MEVMLQIDRVRVWDCGYMHVVAARERLSSVHELVNLVTILICLGNLQHCLRRVSLLIGEKSGCPTRKWLMRLHPMSYSEETVTCSCRLLSNHASSDPANTVLHVNRLKASQPRLVSVQRRIYLARAQNARILQRRQPVAVVDSLIVLTSEHVHEQSETGVVSQRNLIPTRDIFAFRALLGHHLADDFGKSATSGSNRLCKRFAVT